MSASGEGRREHFALGLGRDDDGRITRLEVMATDLSERDRIVRLNGFRVPRAIGPVHDLVRDRGISARSWSRAEPIDLDQATGAQLELLVRAIKPLRRLDRLDHVIQGIAAMSREEAGYWHVQMTNRAGLRALRLLLAEHS